MLVSKRPGKSRLCAKVVILYTPSLRSCSFLMSFPVFNAFLACPPCLECCVRLAGFVTCLQSCHLVWDAVSASLGLSPGLCSILSSAWDAVSGLFSQLVSGLVSQLISLCRLACVRFFNLVLYRLALRWSGFDSSSLCDLMACIVIQPAKRKRNTEEHPNPKLTPARKK